MIRRAAGSNRQRALEVGPGWGVYVPTLAGLYDEVILMDIERKHLDHIDSLTDRHPNLKLIDGDITVPTLPESSFDLILCSEVLEHMPDSQSALREMFRLLRPGGAVVLSTPQRYSFIELAGKIVFLPGFIKLAGLIYREPILESGHINTMTEAELTRQLKNAGFQIRELYKTGMYIPLIGEFFGSVGLRFQQWLEIKLRGGPLDSLFWTQYYLAEKA